VFVSQTALLEDAHAFIARRTSAFDFSYVFTTVYAYALSCARRCRIQAPMELARHWELIANYESYELVKRDYERRHGRTPGTAHAREIAAPFSHARSYFRSARAAELTVKPLLLYYGIVSLSRGLTLLLSRSLRETALTPSHGLSARNWVASLAGEKPDFAALAIAINAGGTFGELFRATDGASLLRMGSSAVNYKYRGQVAAAGLEVTLGELLSRQPALQDHELRWTNATRCAPLAIETEATAPHAILKLQRYGKTHLTREVGDAILAGTPFEFLHEDAAAVAYRGPNDLGSLPGLTDYANINFLGIGDLWLVGTYASGARLSTITALFALSYALGMLVRYFPTQWTALIKGQVDDAALPTLAAAVEFIEIGFPTVVVDFLEDELP
jgi:YaaC-like Protein